MVDGQLALKANHQYLYQVMSPHQTRNMCVHRYKLYFMASDKETGSASAPLNATKIAVKKVSDVDVCMFGPEL